MATQSGMLLELRFNSDPKRLRMVRERVQQIAEELGQDKQFISDLVIAVNEACMNIMQHAYKGDSSGEIVLEIINNGSELIVKITDFAEPIDRREVKPRNLNEVRPGGLGTHFIREIMDDCVYGHLDGKCGNVLSMKKKLN